MPVEFGWLIPLHTFWNLPIYYFFNEKFISQKEMRPPKKGLLWQSLTEYTLCYREGQERQEASAVKLKNSSVWELLLSSAISLLWRSKCLHRQSQQHFKNNCLSSYESLERKTHPPANTPYISPYPAIRIHLNEIKHQGYFLLKNKTPPCSKHALR